MAVWLIRMIDDFSFSVGGLFDAFAVAHLDDECVRE